MLWIPIERHGLIPEGAVPAGETKDGVCYIGRKGSVVGKIITWDGRMWELRYGVWNECQEAEILVAKDIPDAHLPWWQRRSEFDRENPNSAAFAACREEEKRKMRQEEERQRRSALGPVEVDFRDASASRGLAVQQSFQEVGLCSRCSDCRMALNQSLRKSADWLTGLFGQSTGSSD